MADELMAAGTGALGGAAAGSAFGPIGAGIGAAVGLGFGLFGAISGAHAQNQISQAQSQEAQLEAQQNNVRQQAMELSANRSRMELVRNSQRARALALNSATGQGAQFGSGLQGGYGQISGMSGTNLVGINQNTQLGEQMFGLSDQINQQKLRISQLGGQAATAQGFSSLGKSLGASLGPFANLTQQAFGRGSNNNQQQSGIPDAFGGE